jgi:hypothetical protein
MRSVRRAMVSSLVAVAVAGCAAVPARAAEATAVGAHSMLYAQTPFAFKEAMFAEAHAMGMRSIRVGVELPAVIRDAEGARDWRPLDEYARLARRYDMDVTAVLYATPWWLADCPPGVEFADSYRCPARDSDLFARYAAEIVAHARGAIDSWEVLNEPDAPWAYLGSPRQYAAVLAATHHAIKRVDPHAQVLIGGAMSMGSQRWTADVMAALGDDPGASFDVANVHVRGRLDGLEDQLRAWRGFYREHGHVGPLWVTEHGYPSDPEFQRDPLFASGELAQARYLTQSVPTLLGAGAARVFVTERDNLTGAFASEGVLGGTVLDPIPESPRIDRKPAVAALAWTIEEGPPPPPRTRTLPGSFVTRAGDAEIEADFTADRRAMARGLSILWRATCDDGQDIVRRTPLGTVAFGGGYEDRGTVDPRAGETIEWSLDGRFTTPRRIEGRWAATAYLERGGSVLTCRAAPLRWSATNAGGR